MLRSSTSASGTSSAGSQQNINEIVQLLESNNINVIEETTSLVKDSLASSPEPWLLNALVDYYIGSGNVLVRDLLTGIRQPQYKNLLTRIDEHLQKPATRYSALNLFGHVIRKDPIWIHNVIQSRAFATILKCLQMDNDIAVLTIALYFISTLLPKVPSKVGQSLHHIFGIFVRLIAWKNTAKHDSINNLNMANFDAALYALFLSLYGMYPCNFVQFLQHYYCKYSKTSESRPGSLASSSMQSSEQLSHDKDRQVLFKTYVVPMLQQVRLHPALIIYSKDRETSNDKWRKLEPYDITADIAEICLDATENSNGIVSEHKKQDDSCSGEREHPTSVSIQQCFTSPSVTHTVVSYDNDPAPSRNDTSTMIWSPSVEIGLSTPPPSRSISPMHGHATSESGDHTSKAKSDSFESGSRTKTRPSNLVIPDASSNNRPAIISTPCETTPTITMSFDYERDGELFKSYGFDTYLLSTTETTKKSPSVNLEALRYVIEKNDKSVTESSEEVGALTKGMESNSRFSSSARSQKTVDPGDEAFVEITYKKNPEESTLGLPGKSITDFSPALRPSVDPVECAAPVPITNPYSRDESFMGCKNPSVGNILQLPRKRLDISGFSLNEIVNRQVELLVDCDTTSKSNHSEINWKHFGQGPLTEAESRSIRTNMLQMHCALLYERHRREQHATRARRLMRKIYECSSLEERNKALVQTLAQKEHEMMQMQTTVKSQKEEFRIGEIDHRRIVEDCRTTISDLTNQLTTLKVENARLSQEKTKDLELLEQAKELYKNTKSELFTSKLHLQAEMNNKEEAKDLKQEVVHLQRELLIVEELRRRMEVMSRDADNFKVTELTKHNMLVESYRKELRTLNDELRDKSVKYDFMRGKSLEMENRVEKKDRLLDEQKKYLENVKSLARNQIQAMEAKYQAQKSITVRMEEQVMDIYSKLEALKGQNHNDDCMAIRNSKPIQQRQQLGVQGRCSHLIHVSPQLSPPIKGNLEQTSVNTYQLEASANTEP